MQPLRVLEELQALSPMHAELAAPSCTSLLAVGRWQHLLCREQPDEAAPLLTFNSVKATKPYVGLSQLPRRCNKCRSKQFRSRTVRSAGSSTRGSTLVVRLHFWLCCLNRGNTPRTPCQQTQNDELAPFGVAAQIDWLEISASALPESAAAQSPSH